jgi:hypothetical protein
MNTTHRVATVSIENHLEGEAARRVEAIFRKVAAAKSITSEELEVITDCIDCLGLSLETEAKRLAYLVPLDRLDVWFNDENLANCEDLDDQQYSQIDNSQRIAFAREIFRDIGDRLDADLHPGLLALTVTDGKTEIVIGYGITGYSFSGIEVNCIGYGRDQAALCKNLADEYLLIDDSFFIKSTVNKAVTSITDEFILAAWEKKR